MPSTITLKADLDERVLLEALMAAAAIAGTAEAILERTRTVNPAVVSRQDLAPLQAALDHWSAASASVLELEETDEDAPTPLAESLEAREEVDRLDGTATESSLDVVERLDDDEGPTAERARALRRSLEGDA